MARFYWHFVRQAPGLIAALFAAGLTVAVLDITIPVFIGRIVSLVSTHTPKTLIPVAGGQLLLMIVVLLVIRPAALFVQNLITNQAIAPGLTNLVRWQNHWHVARQSWGFFQNDFAGRIATRVMQTGPSLRESVVSGTNAVWYILVYGGSAILLLSQADDRLGIPIMLWFVCYASLIRIFVPRMRERSRRMSEVRSGLTGRIVDSYTNILTVKLFARARNEDAFIRDGIDEHTNAYRRQLRLITIWTMTLAVTNAAMVSGTGALAVWLWMDGRIPVGTVAMAIPMAWQIANMAGWVAQNVTSIFENVGTVQDGMRSIARPLQMPDRADAVPLVLEQGAIRFEKLVFDYGRTSAINFQGRVGGVLRGIDLDIRPGERIGLIGRSGTGKSTLVNLLLHFFDPASGRILVDGQDIAGVTQESLRTAIGMVTQDTSLLHRSIRDNIRFGRPDATEADIRSAAERAHALAFIEHLEDSEGRRGFESHVGERGVKLSGGQRQRIAIARVILKDAPILVLDEATSALDSEVEAAIQEQLTGLMEGRTVIAIAHRLSTIAQMDRLVVLDEGKIAEQGTHQALLARGGIYASLWKRQSGAGEVRDDSRKIAPMSV
ncbi:ABC transporter ATP-binding protein [Acidisoma cladoniae]|uniref:ABC transporter ATP-binding protein n=1 Tax=Acidisoma cladoniae TaxID=3040935 RepID=UPI00254A8BE3|nr:ABC transporter ATP-binding protein [Acidisoma sp. PAMC 29798]